MNDGVWQRDEIQSPCVKICMIHPQTGLCLGCKRTGDEIARWSRMSPEERRTIMDALPGRQGQLTTRSGGRAGRLGRRANGAATRNAGSSDAS